MILLHGLTARGNYFGASYDQLTDHVQLVIPDLAGFARSLDERGDDYSLQVRLTALYLQLDGRALTVAGRCSAR